MPILLVQDLSSIWQTRQVDKSSRDEGLLLRGDEVCCLGNMTIQIESMNGVSNCTVIHSHAQISIRKARENHSRARRDALIDGNNNNKHDA